MTAIKICGIADEPGLKAAAEAGAAYIGFVFYPPSPRAVTKQQAASLAPTAPPNVKKVGLFVDAGPDEIARIAAAVPLDMVQLHGRESPAEIAVIKKATDLPVVKAVSVATPADTADVQAYEDAADWLLFDARPGGPGLPGGRGEIFDWRILANFPHRRPWMLAGGLNTANIGLALRLLKPDAVDVSSGVESAPGHKDPEKIRDFIEAVRKSG